MNHIPVSDMLAGFQHIITATMTSPGVVEVLRSEAFSASTNQAVHARQAVWDTLAGHPDCGTAALLTGELAANAIAHSGSRFFGLAIARTEGDLLRVAVVDEGRTGFPRLIQGRSGAERGRGLALVDSLARRWGIIRCPRAGAAAWFEYGR